MDTVRDKQALERTLGIGRTALEALVIGSDQGAGTVCLAALAVLELMLVLDLGRLPLANSLFDGRCSWVSRKIGFLLNFISARDARSSRSARPCRPSGCFTIMPMRLRSPMRWWNMRVPWSRH